MNLIKKIIIVALIIFSTAFLNSCVDDADDIKLYITCSGGNFTGNVIKSGWLPIEYNGTFLSGTTYYYYGLIPDPESLYITTTIAGGVDASLSVIIYRANDDGDDEIVKNSTLDVFAATTARTLTVLYDKDTDLPDSTTEDVTE